MLWYLLYMGKGHGSIVYGAGKRVFVKQACLARGPLGQTTAGRHRRVGATWCGEDGCSGPKSCKKCRATYARQRRRAGRDQWNSRRDPVRGRARALIYMRLLRGLMVRGTCETCGEIGRWFYQDDLTKPTALRWRCDEHREGR